MPDKKYLRIDIEHGLAGQDITTFIALDGDEDDDDHNQMASDTFFNECNYGYSVVDESDVPEDQRKD